MNLYIVELKGIIIISFGLFGEEIMKCSTMTLQKEIGLKTWLLF